MHISVYIRCIILSPSGYYRVLQYLAPLDVNYKVRNLIPFLFYSYFLNKSRRNIYVQRLLEVIAYVLILMRGLYYLILDNLFIPDVVVISREITPRYSIWPVITLLERLSKRSRTIWDFDDHILLSKEISKKEFDVLSKCSWRIVVTNDYLRKTIDERYLGKVVLLPTTDGDQRKYDLPGLWETRGETFKKIIKLVWVATAANIPNLYRIMPVLECTAKEVNESLGKKLSLTIVSSDEVVFPVEYLILKNVKWSSQRARKEMADAHIGIMPLIDSDYTRGKGSFKLIQYMSIGLPIIASNVGFNKEVVSSDCGFLIDDKSSLEGWKTSILSIADDVENYKRMGKKAYEHWKDSFSFQSNVDVWNSLLNDKV